MKIELNTNEIYLILESIDMLNDDYQNKHQKQKNLNKYIKN